MATRENQVEARLVSDPEALARTESWLARLNAALDGDGAMAALFEPDRHWRDLAALTGGINTTSGDTAPVAFAEAARSAGAHGFRVDPRRYPPRRIERAGRTVIEAILVFDIAIGRGEGVLRLVEDGETARAWTLLTALDALDAVEAVRTRPTVEDEPYARDFHGPNWLDRREASRAYADRDPAVLIVGGGHAGLTTAARLGAYGVDALVVDRMQRVGDNWRKRYHSLALHNEKPSNHLPYLPFPETWPRYIPKDKIANWLEFYVEAMEINFWTETSFDGAEYDAEAGCWIASLTLRDGSTRVMRPRHIVMATSVSGTPIIPEIPTLDRFKGEVMHSSRFSGGAPWRGKRVLVIGTGTSGHDIAQDLHGHGADVTMVQRRPTTIVNITPSAQRYDGILIAEGPSIEDRDLLNLATPLEPMKVAHRILTDKGKEDDRELLEKLEEVGFRLEFGEGGTGWPLKYRTRGGGYYFNVGCSNLIAEGKIAVLQNDAIETFTPGGLALKEGGEKAFDLIVLATGYKGLDHMTRVLFGDAVADRVGPVWGFGENQELRNMWTATPQPGLWFTAGAFSQCRAFSKYLGLQIAGRETGVLG